MKKVMYLMVIPLLCLLSTLWMSMTSTLGENGDFPILTVNDSGGSGGGECYFSLDNFSPLGYEGLIPLFDCSYDAGVVLFAANLELIPGQVGDIIDLSNNPPMHFRVGVEDPNDPSNYVNETKAATIWELISFTKNGEEAIYSSCISFKLPTESFCTNNEIIDLKITYDIFQSTPGGMIPFPVCDYNNVGQIFSCSVFNQIPCDVDEFPCISFLLNSFEKIIEANCLPGCVVQEPIPDLGGGSYSSEITDSNAKFEVEAYPNPFTDELTYSWTGNLGQISRILLYDAVGRLILTKELTGHSGRNQIDTGNLDKGVYYLKTERNDERLFYKLVKI